MVSTIYLHSLLHFKRTQLFRIQQFEFSQKNQIKIEFKIHEGWRREKLDWASLNKTVAGNSHKTPKLKIKNQ